MTTNKGEVLIRTENLKKVFPGGLHALNGVNQEIRKGEVVVIVGPSGSGKSTFLRSLNLLEVPTEGHIYFDGTDLTGKKVDLDKHRQRMGMVFQHFNLFPHMTILKNMTLAPMKLQKRPKNRPWSFFRESAWQTGPTLIRASCPVARNSVSRLSGRSA